MSYLEEFRRQINNRDFSKFLQLWEEYCSSDTVDVEELTQILQSIKASDLAKPFGSIVETALPMWEMIEDKNDAYLVFQLLIDLQTTHSAVLYDRTLAMLKECFGHEALFNEYLRLIGMRNRENFQGALSNCTLLAHMAVGKFVFHGGGWGTGEIVDVSFLREQVSIEFEHVAGRKHLLFTNCFKVLIPLKNDHFLVKRFADPDAFELEAKKDPVGVIKILLRDLGPKTAVEIKDELCDLVIPEPEWVKWWQGARAKLKKDTMVEVPSNLKDSFKLRQKELQHEERFLNLLQDKSDLNAIILTAYSFVRDFPSVLKSSEIKKNVQEKFLSLLAEPHLSKAQELQVQIFLENELGYAFPAQHMQRLIESFANIEEAIEGIDILAFKKRVLTLVRTYRQDWPQIFLNVLFSNQQSLLREYLCKELNQESTQAQLIAELQKLLHHPRHNPEMVVWYFQWILGKEGRNYPFGDKEGTCKWLEAFLILYHAIEFKAEYRDLARKMYLIISSKRYAVIRHVIENSSAEFIREFLLLVSKCQTLSDTDQKILHSLAAVVHPELLKGKTEEDDAEDILWTTEESLMKIQERIEQIGTTEIVANAREIEAARSLGDLRENSEYKFALEKRARLQRELKNLSDELCRSRIITPLDVSKEEVGIGSIVTLLDSKQNVLCYTVLGPWDADPESNVLSLHSKLVQSMIGCKAGEKFRFRDEEYYISSIQTIFDVKV